MYEFCNTNLYGIAVDHIVVLRCRSCRYDSAFPSGWIQVPVSIEAPPLRLGT